MVAFATTAQAVDPPPDGGYPSGNTAEGDNALFSLTTGQFNTAIGANSLYSNTTGGVNTATGAFALSTNTTGAFNTATGSQSLFHNTSGSDNVAEGYKALFGSRIGVQNTAIGNYSLAHNTQGNDNTAEGFLALTHNTTGSNNIAVGASAGIHLTTGSNNIDIGSPGVPDESNAIRIGKKRTQQATFISGIHGTTTAGTNALPVVIDSEGQLGTVSSSTRFKDEIKPMDKTSETILGLKPVTFHYKSDNTGTAQFGLIAEEVAKANPDLVVRDEKGEIYTVRYDAVNAMLLNEFLKEHRTIQEQQTTIANMKIALEKQQVGIARQNELEERVARQQGQIEALTAIVQNVNAQVELSKSAPQTVAKTQ